MISVPFSPRSVFRTLSNIQGKIVTSFQLTSTVAKMLHFTTFIFVCFSLNFYTLYTFCVYNLMCIIRVIALGKFAFWGPSFKAVWSFSDFFIHWVKVLDSSKIIVYCERFTIKNRDCASISDVRKIKKFVKLNAANLFLSPLNDFFKLLFSFCSYHDKYYPMKK